MPPPPPRKPSPRRKYPVAAPAEASVPEQDGPSALHRALVIVLRPAGVGVAVLLCVALGFVTAQGGPRRDRAKPEKVAVVTPEPEKKPDPEPEKPKEKPKAVTPAADKEKPKEKPKAKPPEEKVVVKAPEPKPKEKPAEKPKDTPKPPPEPGTPTVTFVKDIKPIFDRACASCHMPGKTRGGLDLSSLASVSKGGDTGGGIVAGKPDEGTIYESVASGNMPPAGAKLPDADIKKIREWILAGAK